MEFKKKGVHKLPFVMPKFCWIFYENWNIKHKSVLKYVCVKYISLVNCLVLGVIKLNAGC